MTLFVQTLVLGVLIGGIYSLAASGLTLIFGVMDVVNVAHGALLIFAGFLAWQFWDWWGMDPLVSIVLTTPLMFGLGLLLYLGTLRRIRGMPVSMTVILTFAIAIVLEGVMGFVWGNTSHSVRAPYFTESFHVGDVFFPKAQVYGFVAAIVVLGALFVVLTRTWLGRAIRAASQNPQSARLIGVNIGFVAAMTFSLGVATTGAGGSILSVLYPFVPGSHVAWISRLLGIIVLGGMGSLPGAVIGALLFVARRDVHRHVHLDPVGDDGAVRAHLRRPAPAAAGDHGRAPARGRGRVNRGLDGGGRA